MKQEYTDLILLLLFLIYLGFLNDLWRYRLSDNSWTWMSGSDTVDQAGNYGGKGIPASTNVPGARWGAVGCYDSSRKEFWMFGGLGLGVFSW